MLITAHSLPERILQSGDTYPRRADARPREALAERLGLERWSVAWQSAGRTADPWIGPDVLEVMGDLAAAGTPAVVVCSAGFVADHLEVLFDLDIEARERADELGHPVRAHGVRQRRPRRDGSARGARCSSRRAASDAPAPR